jgi:hypothetical protein
MRLTLDAPTRQYRCYEELWFCAVFWLDALRTLSFNVDTDMMRVFLNHHNVILDGTLTDEDFEELRQEYAHKVNYDLSNMCIQRILNYVDMFFMPTDMKNLEHRTETKSEYPTDEDYHPVLQYMCEVEFSLNDTINEAWDDFVDNSAGQELEQLRWALRAKVTSHHASEKVLVQRCLIRERQEILRRYIERWRLINTEHQILLTKDILTAALCSIMLVSPEYAYDGMYNEIDHRWDWRITSEYLRFQDLNPMAVACMLPGHEYRIPKPITMTKTPTLSTKFAYVQHMLDATLVCE